MRAIDEIKMVNTAIQMEDYRIKQEKEKQADPENWEKQRQIQEANEKKKQIKVWQIPVSWGGSGEGIWTNMEEEYDEYCTLQNLPFYFLKDNENITLLKNYSISKNLTFLNG